MSVSNSLSSLFKKEQLWANCSHCSLQKSDESKSLFNKESREWFACFLRANQTFALQKWAIRWKKFIVFTISLTVFKEYVLKLGRVCTWYIYILYIYLLFHCIDIKYLFIRFRNLNLRLEIRKGGTLRLGGVVKEGITT